MNIPSANNSTNERSVRRQNCKDQIKRAAEAKKVLMSAGEAHAKFGKLATAFNAAGKVAHLEGNRYRVFVGSGAKFYPVYLICGSFKCDCRDHAAYGFCAHTKAAAMFAADANNKEANRLKEPAAPVCGCRYDGIWCVFFCDAHYHEQMAIDAAEEAHDLECEYFYQAGEIDRFYQDLEAN